MAFSLVLLVFRRSVQLYVGTHSWPLTIKVGNQLGGFVVCGGDQGNHILLEEVVHTQKIVQILVSVLVMRICVLLFILICGVQVVQFLFELLNTSKLFDICIMKE